MGLTREYLRYAAGGKFNIIASSECNVAFVTYQGFEGRFVAVGACEDVIIWDLRLLEKALVLNGEKSEVTRLCPSPVKKFLAAGYADGAIQVFDLTDPENPVSYIGHKSAITCLSYDWSGQRLASGSKDTDIIVWDVVSECGLHRLNGHRGVVTQVLFHGPDHPSLLISSSKDTFVKFWDLETQHCFKTLIGHRTEVWDISILKDGKYLVTGCGDSELRVWSMNFIDNEFDEKPEVRELDKTFLEEDGDSVSLYPLRCHKAGSILRNGLGRVMSLAVDSSGFFLACYGADTKVEIFQFRKELEATLKAKKRLRRERKKALKDGGVQPEINDQDAVEVTLKDEVLRLPVLKIPPSDGKIKSTALISGKGGELRIAIASRHNVLSLYSLMTLDFVDEAKKEDCYKTLGTVTKLGHRSEVRTLCFSSDNLGVLSASSEAIKLWNRPSLSCLRTVTGEDTKSGKVSSIGYVLSACFVPGDRHAIIGMRDGRLLIADIGAGDILEEIPAHSKEVWSICLTHDEKGCISGGGDSTVRFWSFELIEDKKQPTEDSDGTVTKGKILSLFNTRALKLEETVLCICITPNGRFIAVALLDSTVKIFFIDTLKFFLSLYGHKLPVACMDISSDSKLIATGGGDRNVKIWGLDFGDCHRSLFAHDDSITAIKFVPKTHLFFTCGRDGRVKQWDADTFTKIITLPGHRGEAWALTVSPNGKFVVSAGSDHVLRVWEKTEEPLVLEDQEEVEREEEANERDALATGEGTVVPGQHGSNLPSRKTAGSEKAAEEIMEAIEVFEDYKSKLTAHEETCKALKLQGKKDLPPPPVPPLLMTAFKISCPNRFLIETIRRIRSSDLEEALLLLPFSWACRFLEASPDLFKHCGPDVELLCRTLLFLVRVHQAPIIGATHLFPLVTNITQLAFKHLKQLRDVVGYNLHGLEFLQREIEIKDGVQLFREATLDKREKDKKKKRREKAIKRAILTL
ncbi:WD repeat-containing protein 3 [Ischnura elegans]|uniref:WD repeat-containing protein 3 n=1 Tax=Ischnura elegans TaxID=197161 RepID=UPI001ED874F2|nr:WD repeat-containing protein 3 [Ischnura elegans]